MVNNPFVGACDPISIPKKKRKKMVVIKRNDIECSCGALEKFFTSWAAYHDKECIIVKNNKKQNNKRKGKR